MWKVLASKVWAAVVFLLTILGLGGLKDDMDQWHVWASAVTPHVASALIGAGFLGLVLFVIANIKSSYDRKQSTAKKRSDFESAAGLKREARQSENWLHKREVLILLSKSSLVKEAEVDQTEPGAVNVFVEECLARVENECPGIIRDRLFYNERLFRLWLDQEEEHEK